MFIFGLFFLALSLFYAEQEISIAFKQGDCPQGSQSFIGILCKIMFRNMFEIINLYTINSEHNSDYDTFLIKICNCACSL